MTIQRRLTLLRHGHAEASAPGGDIDRALDDTGRTEVLVAASALARFERASKLLVSSAKRTRETAAIVIEKLALEHVFVEYLPELYLASAATLRRIIESQSDEHEHVCLIGHNPGLSDFTFDALPDLSQREAYRGLKTAGWTSWQFTAAHWSHFAPNASYAIAQG